MFSVIAVPSFVIRSASHGGTCPPCKGRSATPDRFTRLFSHRLDGFACGDLHGLNRYLIRGLTIFLTHAPNIKPCSKDHREQDEHRDHHYKCVPQLLHHCRPPFMSDSSEVKGRCVTNLIDQHGAGQDFSDNIFGLKPPTYKKSHQ